MKRNEKTGQRQSGAVVALVVLGLVLLSAFGPYVASGIRTEQIAVYTLAVTSLVGLAIRPPVRILGAILACWVVYALWACVSALSPGANFAPYPRGELLAGVDNLALPIAVIVVVHALVPREIAQKVLRVVAMLIVGLLGVNVLAAFWTLTTGYAWTSWWSSGETSTGARALTQSRVSGLVNQPAEAGFLYGIAILCALYLWSNRPKVGYPIILFLVAGGVLTVSKIFLLAALPLAVWHVVVVQGRRTARQFGLVLALGGIWVALQAGVFSAWSGVDQLQRALMPSAGRSLVQQASGNRFGEASTVRPLIEGVWASAPLAGFGAGGLSVAYDNAWVEAFVVGGVVGAFLLTLTLVLMCVGWWRAPISAERTLLGALVILIGAACLGLPALTANRASTTVWVLLSLLFISLDRGVTRNSERQPSGRARSSGGATLRSPRTEGWRELQGSLIERTPDS